MPRYTISEPHPTVSKGAYTHSGRGGAGNMFRAPTTTAPAGVPTAAAPVKQSTRFYSGRGGAGNAHAAVDRPVLDFEEEYTAAAAHEKLGQGHVGRGGAGNIYAASKKSHQHGKDAASRRDSSSTSGSSRSGFWGRLSGQF